MPERAIARPKVVYCADRLPELTQAAFTDRWLQHGALAMALPIWRNMWKYAQCDPRSIDGESPGCDAIGLVWYRGWDALDAIAREPAMRQPLLDDELLTFSGHVRDCAMMTGETVLQDGEELADKVFVFADGSTDVAAAIARTEGHGRLVRSDAVRNEYTTQSRLDHDAVYEAWYGDADQVAEAWRLLRNVLPPDRCRVVAVRERHLYGPAPHA